MQLVKIMETSLIFDVGLDDFATGKRIKHMELISLRKQEFEQLKVLTIHFSGQKAVSESTNLCSLSQKLRPSAKDLKQHAVKCQMAHTVAFVTRF
ncbi:hypothetical protein AVEN_148615-1 [Araneus ventricosus]|uniref:Uncharacterized protein n=1 Tax=Araneus ventricosus TaxID=182803 RepID=A0A4Y2R016_ARAVE|nr:hypothetical protein AVEN_186294-1 [Araneus ventricosus]GBN69049.1 hypothetical protein AVEN_148615-1 [Araneus ventricosus]